MVLRFRDVLHEDRLVVGDVGRPDLLAAHGLPGQLAGLDVVVLMMLFFYVVKQIILRED